LLGTSIAAGQAQAKLWFHLAGYYYVDKARADEVLRHGTTTLFAALEVATGRVTDAWNDRCTPFTWTKDPDTVIAKATHPRKRKAQTTSVTEH
jgi:hypothetical protein